MAPFVNAAPSSSPREPGAEIPASPAAWPAAGQRWHLVTGEYPPGRGGVSDYSALVAEGLARAGAEVHVWAPGDPVREEEGGAARVALHGVAGAFEAADLACLDRALAAYPVPRRLLVQYTPNAFRGRGLNLGFIRWLGRRRDRGDEIHLMVHEPYYPLRLRDRPTRWLLAVGQRWMIRGALAASHRVYAAIPAWEDCLRPLAEAGLVITWLPVPSNVPVVEDRPAVAKLRARLALDGQLIVGSFGTYAPMIADLLAEVLPSLLAGRGDRVGLLLGGGGPRMATRMVARDPGLAGVLRATGHLDPRALSLHLAACDLVVQPYPDGVSSRRGSVMAALAHGLPVVTNLGFLSEPTWRETGCVSLAEGPRPSSLVARAQALLADPRSRSLLGRQARRVYDERFAVERTIEQLVRA